MLSGTTLLTLWFILVLKVDNKIIPLAPQLTRLANGGGTLGYAPG